MLYTEQPSQYYFIATITKKVQKQTNQLLLSLSNKLYSSKCDITIYRIINLHRTSDKNYSKRNENRSSPLITDMFTFQPRMSCKTASHKRPGTHVFFFFSFKWILILFLNRKINQFVTVIFHHMLQINLPTKSQRRI